MAKLSDLTGGGGAVVDVDGNEYLPVMDPSLRLQWSFTGFGNNVDAVAVDSNGNVYGGSDDNTLRKIDAFFYIEGYKKQ